jgi:hypothetical protein
MMITAFRSAPANVTDWTRVRWLFAGTLALMYVSRAFAVRGLMAHTTYVVFPVVALFAAMCWQVRAAARGGRMRAFERLAGLTLLSSIVMHAGIAIDRLPRESLYVDRDLVVAAIKDRNDRYLGERRYSEASRPAEPAGDLEVVRAGWSAALGGRFSAFSPAIRNRSRTAAWMNIRYATTYFGAGGERLTERGGRLNQVLQPGEFRTWYEVADGPMPTGAERATLAVIDAEKVIPALASPKR